MRGWKIIAREASWRCWAMLSATSFNAAILSSSEVRIWVVRGGMSSRGLAGTAGGEEVGVMRVAIVEREDGGRVWRGGRDWLE